MSGLREDTAELVLAASGSVIEMESNGDNNFFVLCVNSSSKEGEHGDMSLFFVSKDGERKLGPISRIFKI